MEVTWVDANTDVSHEILLDDGKTTGFGGLIVCEDVGYLVRKNKTEVVLAQSRCADNSIRVSNTIPAGWVKSITYLDPRPTESTDAQDCNSRTGDNSIPISNDRAPSA